MPRARVIELQGRLTRLQTVAALSKARLYVGADSIWTQLAVAAGVARGRIDAATEAELVKALFESPRLIAEALQSVEDIKAVAADLAKADADADDHKHRGTGT